jgi:hypothetical protein
MSPDEECALCSLTRENHGDAHHEFSVDGSLKMLKKPEPARQTPPAERGTEQIKAKSFAMLLEVLSEKGILNSVDLIRIFSADN